MHSALICYLCSLLMLPLCPLRYGTYQTFSDNDSLASYVSVEMSAHVIPLLTA